MSNGVHHKRGSSGSSGPRILPTKRKYRHVTAYHSQERVSCLSRESQVVPSFLGFRNLMVIVLGRILTPFRIEIGTDSIKKG